MGLTQDQILAYEADGFLSGLQVADEEKATQIRKRFDFLEAQEGREKCRLGLLDRHFDQKFIWDLAVHPKVLDRIEALIGPDFLLLATHFFCKYGPDEKFVAWHQDVTYWGLKPPEAITAWYAVDPSDRGNGCVRVIPGSHRQGMLTHGKAEQEGNLLSVNQEVRVSEADEGRAVDLVLKAGEISIHHGQTIHGSLPNQSTRRRCGLTIRYVPPWVKPVQRNSMGKTWAAILVRGVDEAKHFGKHPNPFPAATGPVS